MTAAAITPTTVQKTYLYSTVTTGTAAPKRLIRYLVVLTKATQSDWFVTDTYCPGGTVIGATGYTIDSSGDATTETITYTNSGTKLVLGSATVGTDYIEVLVMAD